MERLQKVIAHAGLASRRAAEKMIQDGRVQVNGQVVTELGTKVDKNDLVLVDGQPIGKEEQFYFLMNKPDKVVSTVSDDKGRKTVLDLFDELPARLYPVGRLDYHTTGALLLTNDGELANQLMHPSSEVEKVYRARVEGIPTDQDLNRLRRGIEIDGRKTAPARVRRIKNRQATRNATLEITLHEGRNRQIRKMCDAIGHPVKNLKRIRYAFLTVDGMAAGEYRELSRKEVARLYGLVRGG